MSDPGESPVKRLYSSGQIALAAFLGSPMAASWFFARNYRSLSEPARARKCLFWGVTGSVELFILAYYLPDDLPNFVLPLIYISGLRVAAQQIHGKIVEEHLAAGGRLGSWWRVVGISLLFLVLILAAILAVLIIWDIVLDKLFQT